MKASKQYYLMFRETFLRLGYHYEVAKLDSHFKIMLVHDNKGRLIKTI